MDEVKLSCLRPTWQRDISKKNSPINVKVNVFDNHVLLKILYFLHGTPKRRAKKTPGRNSLSKFFIRTIHVIKYLHAEDGNADSDSDGCGRKVQKRLLPCDQRLGVSGESLLLVGGDKWPHYRSRGGEGARVTLGRDPICCMCMFIGATETATEKNPS